MMNPPLHCTTIPAENPFIATLAAWVLAHYGRDPAVLTRVLVLLPSRRACRSLREAFLDITGGKPILLPRIQPIGDMEEDPAHYHTTLGLPPVIAPMRRRMLLTRLVMRFHAQYHVGQAAELAEQLASFIDDVAREGLSFAHLSALAPEELAVHWQQTIDFLAIVSQYWPRILEEEGALDPAEHRNRVIKATADAWQKQPPEYPIIAAGSTGSIPATAELLATIARLPQGMVILPGLDTEMPEAEWKLIDETHPQFGLRQLLERMECKRCDVKSLHESQATHFEPRTICLRAILQPPETTAGWPQAKLPLKQGLQNVRLIEADTQLDEARMIAVALRETLETPEKTAALVTPDRNLARMVASQMQRFGVSIDDSAGRPLKDTPPGYLMRLALDAAASKFSPVSLLALLRHPLAGAGMEPAECRRISRLLDAGYLRGARRSGFDTLRAATAGHKGIAPLLSAMDTHMRSLAECFEQKSAPLKKLLEAHMASGEWLASTADKPGAAQLWAGNAGNALAAFLADVLQHADVLGNIDPVSYPAVFETLLAGQVWRPRYGLHPRLHILSPIEARLLQFDRVILGGLNEGSWPSAPQADPWMSRPMRAAFGLPAPERHIGQSAHDMVMLCAAPEVLLSRARKVEGAPTVPSRWLVRLETLAKGLDAEVFHRMQAREYYGRGMRLLDTPMGYALLKPPEPMPPVEARPRKLRVTAIDAWLRDPYVIYAQYILGLKSLEPLDEEPDAADFGNLVHKALERFIGAWPEALPENAKEILLECGRISFQEFLDRPGIACLWWPRFEAIAGWLVAQEKERRRGIKQVIGEVKGEWNFPVGGKPFTLTTRIDRLEIGRDGKAIIVDYKTGAVPTQAEIERGLANQLPLEALIAQYGTLIPHGGISGIAGLEYWKLAGNAEDSEIRAVGIEHIEAAKLRLEALIRTYDDAQKSYAAQSNPLLTLRYNDYEHLTRRQEWEAV